MQELIIYQISLLGSRHHSLFPSVSLAHITVFHPWIPFCTSSAHQNLLLFFLTSTLCLVIALCLAVLDLQVPIFCVLKHCWLIDSGLFRDSLFRNMRIREYTGALQSNLNPTVSISVKSFSLSYFHFTSICNIAMTHSEYVDTHTKLFYMKGCQDFTVYANCKNN